MADRRVQELNFQESKLGKVGAVQVYARRDDHDRPFVVDAFDEDRGEIERIADGLQRIGYGVMRRSKPRAGRVYHVLKARWAGPDHAPADPLAEAGLLSPDRGRTPTP